MFGQSRGSFDNTRTSSPTWSGSHRGRWRGRGRGGSSFATHIPESIPNLLDGLRKNHISTIQRPLSSTNGVPSIVQITDVQPVSSYNWLESKQPTIVVPGSCFSNISSSDVSELIIYSGGLKGAPALWKEPSPSLRLQRDSKDTYIDQNRARVPKHPLLPLVLAVEDVHPTYDFSVLDIVTDRNNLRKLCRFLSDEEKESRIDLELGGDNTVIFTRWESNTISVAKNNKYLGYGKNFEEYCAREQKGCENSTGHHRIISYVSFLSSSSHHRVI